MFTANVLTLECLVNTWSLFRGLVMWPGRFGSMLTGPLGVRNDGGSGVWQRRGRGPCGGGTAAKGRAAQAGGVCNVVVRFMFVCQLT